MSKPTPTVREYVKKLQDLQPDDPELDAYLDEVADDADELSERKRARKRVAKALLAAATALEAATSSDDLVKDMEEVKAQIDKAIALAKRKQFDKAQDAFESALWSADVVLQTDSFREADLVEQGEAEGEADHPSWAR